MTTPDTPSTSPQINPRPPRSRVPLLLAIVLILIAAGIGAGISYFVLVHRPVEESKQQTNQNLMRMTGLANPVKNKLDDRFTDADGDGVADPPTDPKQYIDPP